ncbi:MAG: chemotaxis protein CheW [Fervidobacterium sp.]|uniref:chemotaxis protein CheW n=1 Tax=Fervidobacterium sp. TaxID=1871331 RepID=UPI0040495070
MPSEKMLVFALEENYFAVPLNFVSGIAQISSITPLPLATKEVAGLVNYYGKILMVVDMKILIKDLEKAVDRAENFQNAKMVILNNEGLEIGIIVDRVKGIKEIEEDNSKRSNEPEGSIISHEYIEKGVVVNVLNVQSLFRKYMKDEKFAEGKIIKTEREILQKTPENEFVIFSSGENSYAVSSSEIQYIIKDAKIHNVTNAPKEVIGKIEFDGVLVPVVSSEYLLAGRTGKASRRFLIIRNGNRLFGIGVSKVERVVKLMPEDIYYPPYLIGSENELVGVILEQEQAIPILSMDALLQKYQQYFVEFTESHEKEAVEEISILVFKIADSLFGLESDYVDSISKLSPITPIDNVPSTVLGVMNYRQENVIVIDLLESNKGLIEELRSEKFKDSKKVIILRNCEFKAGILVDKLEGIFKTQLNLITTLSTTQSEEKLIKGFMQLRGFTVPLINPRNIVSSTNNFKDLVKKETEKNNSQIKKEKKSKRRG